MVQALECHHIGERPEKIISADSIITNASVGDCQGQIDTGQGRRTIYSRRRLRLLASDLRLYQRIAEGHVCVRLIG